VEIIVDEIYVFRTETEFLYAIAVSFLVKLLS